MPSDRVNYRQPYLTNQQYLNRNRQHPYYPERPVYASKHKHTKRGNPGHGSSSEGLLFAENENREDYGRGYQRTWVERLDEKEDLVTFIRQTISSADRVVEGIAEIVNRDLEESKAGYFFERDRLLAYLNRGATTPVYMTPTPNSQSTPRHGNVHGKGLKLIKNSLDSLSEELKILKGRRGDGYDRQESQELKRLKSQIILQEEVFRKVKELLWQLNGHNSRYGNIFQYIQILERVQKNKQMMTSYVQNSKSRNPDFRRKDIEKEVIQSQRQLQNIKKKIQSSLYQKSSRQQEKRKKNPKHRSQQIQETSSEYVPINHLERLERIIIQKIIPLLQRDYEPKVHHKTGKKKYKQAFGEQFADGLRLLQRLTGRERVSIEESAQILERFISKVLDKEGKLIEKMGKYQQKLEEKEKIVRQIEEQLKYIRGQCTRIGQNWERQKRKATSLSEALKSLRVTLLGRGQIGRGQWSNPEADELGIAELNKEIKRLQNEGQKTKRSDKQKRCEHKKEGKQVHAVCREDKIKAELQLKNLKEVIQILDRQVILLRQQCERLEGQLIENEQKRKKLQYRVKKLTQENISLGSLADKLQAQNRQKNIVIQNYIDIIGRFQQKNVIANEQIERKKQELQGTFDIIKRGSQEREQLLRHIQHSSQRIKYVEELLENRDAQLDNLGQTLLAKQRESNILQHKLQETLKELYLLKTIQKQIQQKNLLIDQLTANLNSQKIEQLQLVIPSNIQKLHLQSHNIQGKGYIQEENERINALNSQTILKNQEQEPKREAPHSNTDNLQQLYERNEFQKLILEMRQIIHQLKEQNGDLKSQLEKKKVDELTNFKKQGLGQKQNLQLSLRQKQQLEYLRSITYNLVGRTEIQTEKNLTLHLQNIQRKQQNKLKIKQHIQSQNKTRYDQSFEGIIDGEIYAAKQPQKSLWQDMNEQIENAIESKIDPHIHRSTDGLILIEGQISHEKKEVIHPIPTINVENNQFSEGIPAVLNKKHQEQTISQVYNQETKLQTSHSIKKASQIDQRQLKRYQIRISELEQQIRRLSEELMQSKRVLIQRQQENIKRLSSMKDDEIEILKKRLDEALIANEILQRGFLNSDGSGFTAPEHLNSFIKRINSQLNSQSPSLEVFVESPSPPITKEKQQSNKQEMNKKPDSREIEYQTYDANLQNLEGTQQQLEKIVSQLKFVQDKSKKQGRLFDDQQPFSHNIIEIQIVQSLGQNLKREDKAIQKKSFIDQLNDISRGLATEERKQELSNRLKQQTVNQITQLIDFHESQILNLHKKLRSQTSHFKEKYIADFNDVLVTPSKRTIRGDESQNKLMRAPQKFFPEDRQIAELREMFTQRQAQFEGLLIQKQQQVDRLKAIIKRLSKGEERPSRDNSASGRDLIKSPQQKQKYIVIIDRQKDQIQKLQILINQKDLELEIYKLQKSRRVQQSEQQAICPHCHGITQFQGQITNENLENNNYLNNQKIVFRAQEDEKMDQREQIMGELDHISETKSKQQLLLSKSHDKQKHFQRTSQRFDMERDSPSHARGLSTLSNQKWQQLVPEFFGKKHS